MRVLLVADSPLGLLPLSLNHWIPEKLAYVCEYLASNLKTYRHLSDEAMNFDALQVGISLSGQIYGSLDIFHESSVWFVVNFLHYYSLRVVQAALLATFEGIGVRVYADIQ